MAACKAKLSAFSRQWLRSRGFCNRRVEETCTPGLGNGAQWTERDTDGVVGFGLAAETGDQIGCGWTSDFASRAQRRQAWILVRTDLTAQGCLPNQAGCQPEVDACASNPCSRYSEAGTNACIDADDYFLAIQTQILAQGQDIRTANIVPGYTCTCNEGWTGRHCVSLRLTKAVFLLFVLLSIERVHRRRTCSPTARSESAALQDLSHRPP